MPDSHDADEANWIIGKLEEAFNFSRSRNDPLRPAIFSKPQRTRTLIFIYYVRDEKPQLDIVSFAKKLKESRRLKPITVEFYDGEEIDSTKERRLKKYEIE